MQIASMGSIFSQIAMAWLIGLLLSSLVQRRHVKAGVAAVLLALFGLAVGLWPLVKEVLFTHMRDIRPLTLRLTYAELSGVTALDFMVEGLDHTPLTETARVSLRPQVKDLIEETTTRGFRVKLVL